MNTTLVHLFYCEGVQFFIKSKISFSDGCRRDDGSFVSGGETWALSNCKMGICAKSLKGGWQIAIERYII